MVRRSAFVELKRSHLLTFATALAMLELHAVPVLAVAFAAPRLASGRGAALLLVAGALGLVLMAVAYRPIVRWYRLSAAWTFTLPLAAVLYTAMTVDSALRHTWGRGPSWRGRSLPAAAGAPARRRSLVGGRPPADGARRAEPPDAGAPPEGRR